MKLWQTIFLLNNGYTSKYFHVRNGVLQGDPLSSLLFIIGVEILAIAIRENKNVKGIRLNETETKIGVLADDTTLFLMDILSLRNALNVILLFYFVSGLKINIDKSEVLQIGRKTVEYINIKPYDLKWSAGNIKSLGIRYFNNVETINDVNLKEKLEEFQAVLTKWSKHPLTLCGKICIVKSLALPKIIYVTNVLWTPEWFINKVITEINSFIWGKMRHWIQKDVLIQDYKDGGLRNLEYRSFMIAQKIVWVKRLVNNPKSLSSEFIAEYIPKQDLSFTLALTMEPDRLSRSIPIFYQQILDYWYNAQRDPTSIKDIRGQCLWYNKYIKINGECYFNAEMSNKRINILNDILNENGVLMDANSIKNEFNLRANILTINSIISAIPKSWKSILKQSSNTNYLYCKIPTLKMQTYEKQITKIESRHIYWCLVKSKRIAPSCIERWKKSNITLSDSQWREIFIKTKYLTKIVKHKLLNLKIMHKNYASDVIVAKFDKSVNSKCNLCNDENDIIHVFCMCKNVTLFWKLLENWVKRNIVPNITIDTRMKLLGCLRIDVPNQVYYVIDYMLLQARIYIHRSNIKNENVYFTVFLSILRKNTEIECRLYNVNSKKFSDLRSLLDLL